MQLLYKEGSERKVDAGKRLDARVRVAPENFASTADACSANAAHKLGVKYTMR